MLQRASYLAKDARLQAVDLGLIRLIDLHRPLSEESLTPQNLKQALPIATKANLALFKGSLTKFQSMTHPLKLLDLLHQS